MNGRLKFLSIALIAALAISSIVASVGVADVLTAEAGPVTLTGQQEGSGDVVKIDAGEVKCTTVKFTGVSNELGAKSITVSPTFSGCTLAGLASAVSPNGCNFLITLNPAAGNTTSTLDIVCPAGKEVTVTSPSAGPTKCIVHLPPQEGIETATTANIGTGATKEITVSLKLAGVKYNQTAGTAETGNCATADSTTNGTYTGTEIFTGEVSGSHVGIFLS